MVASPSSSGLSPEQYLKLEETSPIKHEYIDVEIYATAGATDAHVTLTGNLFAALLTHLRGSDCRVYFSDMKVQVDAVNRYYYPDIMVTCNQQDKDETTFKRHPKFIAEVLSDSTVAFDRGDKFADYQTLESLQEYVLINTHRQRVECFRRNEKGLWILQSYASSDECFVVESVGFRGAIAALYENVQAK
ncbi:conserved hypothetical protein [Synechococcus sp. PCC 7335]|uniref:Uma2 family endonuclease n=1 Tax=Synechococcus sp. (strain ATCC 29403 / PCC 7335) TaxID=91464 RepID=UPI00017EE039|nr:Uma2 family endonuclease [Synechococcus sp. PCC 7335]EDX86025.1 conserved hypothetical protein [Synechococcus sp. PCC 7335]